VGCLARPGAFICVKCFNKKNKMPFVKCYAFIK
jgi:hypothetical protein